MINIDFTKTNGVYTLQDAIWLEDNHTFTNEEIEIMKQDRFDNWLAIITTTQGPA
jgi:hypothetical protein